MKLGGESLAIVVRSAGERTESVCVAALRSQSAGTVEVVREQPFLAALRRSIRIGVDSAREFTLCVDADVVLASGAVSRILRRLKRAPDAFFVCGFLLDKYYGEPKARGVHLYRTKFLEEASFAIPTSDLVERPETVMKEVLIGRGRGFAYVDDRPIGLHGFGQYYRDVFRTMASRGRKSSDQFAPLMKRFARSAGTNLDLQVALWGLVASVDGGTSLDPRVQDAEFGRLLTLASISEKAPLSAREERTLKILATIAGATPLALWRSYRRIRGPSEAAVS